MKLKIIGCGSPLMGDDAIGLIAARDLRARMKHPDIEIVEAGTPGLGLLDVLEGADVALILDAICSGSPPGTLRCFSADELPSREFFPLSLHQFNIIDALTLGRLATPEKLPPKIIILGIEVQDPRPGLDISPSIAAALPYLVQRVVEIVHDLGENHRADSI